MMGESAGLTFRNDGGWGMPGGSSGVARLMAVRMSGGTSLILRLKLNCSVMDVLPSVLMEVIESRPSIEEHERSSGVATAEAMVSALAPGRLALTETVGKSTFGRSLTGRVR